MSFGATQSINLLHESVREYDPIGLNAPEYPRMPRLYLAECPLNAHLAFGRMSPDACPHWSECPRLPPNA